jgi:hypothetical protein
MLAVSDPSVLKSDYVLPPDYEIMTETAEVFTKALLLGMEPEPNNFADDVDVLPFEEAVAYMRKRLPVDGKTYYALADKMRFRAFTVSRLADGDAVRHVQSMLVKAMDEGSGIQQFLQLTEGQLADAAGMGKGAGWYYETVYRTNTATAYNVGRAIGFEETPPVALELIGIDDARQTEICHSLTVPPFRNLTMIPCGNICGRRFTSTAAPRYVQFMTSQKLKMPEVLINFTLKARLIIRPTKGSEFIRWISRMLGGT